MNRSGVILLAAAAILLPLQVPAQEPVQEPRQEQQAPASAEDVILEQLQAFNAGNVEAMVANVADDFVWFAVDAMGVVPQLQGRAAFHRSMTEYFRSVTGTRAAIEEMFPVGDFIAVRERSYWVEGGQELSQASLAVYEIRNDLIRRVWYYPASE